MIPSEGCNGRARVVKPLRRGIPVIHFSVSAECSLNRPSRPTNPLEKLVAVDDICVVEQ
jgi:hypothetical protein